MSKIKSTKYVFAFSGRNLSFSQINSKFPIQYFISLSLHSGQKHGRADVYPYLHAYQSLHYTINSGVI